MIYSISYSVYGLLYMENHKLFGLDCNPIITTFGMLLNQIFESPSERNSIPLIAISILILNHALISKAQKILVLYVVLS